jgi:hypothetical protein
MPHHLHARQQQVVALAAAVARQVYHCLLLGHLVWVKGKGQAACIGPAA